MIHIHCDRCKADIDPEGKIGKMSWGFKNGIEGMVSSDLLYGRVYCERCMDLTMAFISGRVEPARGQGLADLYKLRKETSAARADHLRGMLQDTEGLCERGTIAAE